jgi:hypothetical protein
MSSSQEPDPAFVVESLVRRDGNGVMTVSGALLCTLYLRQDFQRGLRPAIKEFILTFVDVTQDRLRWLLPTPTGPRSIARASLGAELGGTLNRLANPDAAWELHLHGGEQPESASDLGLEISLRRRWESEPPHNHLSFVSCRFPLQWFRDGPQGFRSFVTSASELLQPVHGYAGIGLVTAADRFLASQFNDDVAALAERFPGLEIDYPVKHLVWLRTGIKGVNWLTILGNETIERFGGLERLQSALPAAAALHAFRGGCLIQAGPAPRIGDRNLRLGVEDYRSVAVALKPLRITTHGAVHGTTGLDRARFEAWLARFDET